MRIHKNAVPKRLLLVADALELFLLLMDKVLFLPVLYLIHIVIDICPKHIEDGTACNIVFSLVAEFLKLTAYLVKADCKAFIAKGEGGIALFYANFGSLGNLGRLDRLDRLSLLCGCKK